MLMLNSSTFFVADIVIHCGRYGLYVANMCDCHRRRPGGALSENAALAMPRLDHISGRAAYDRGQQISITYRSTGPRDSDCAGGRLLSTNTGL